MPKNLGYSAVGTGARIHPPALGTPRQEPGTPAVRCQLWRNALLDVTTLVLTTAYHRRSYTKRYSRFYTTYLTLALLVTGSDTYSV
jgi:hypothetical protein